MKTDVFNDELDGGLKGESTLDIDPGDSTNGAAEGSGELMRSVVLLTSVAPLDNRRCFDSFASPVSSLSRLAVVGLDTAKDPLRLEMFMEGEVATSMLISDREFNRSLSRSDPSSAAWSVVPGAKIPDNFLIGGSCTGIGSAGRETEVIFC